MDNRARTAYPRAIAVECPDADTLGSLISDGLPASERAAVANHAASCPSCHAVVSALVGTMVGWPRVTGTVPTIAGRVNDDPMQLRPGEQVDRYVIEERLGAGGMGVVYAARDPDLGRRVAVKLLRAGAADDRLRREAQALARLAHANVVAVYDVGTHHGQIFIAMALVEGANLRHWLQTARPVDDILGRLIAAGRGLAAAHAAGLIHRDLKPDNIFVAAGGQALVGDFGLARELEDADADVLATGATATSLAAPDLTITGTVVGTPAYMGPEQADGEATAASDQFSFCVTAWEALYRTRPYGGGSFEEIQAAVRAGRITPPQTDPGVPSEVHQALLRGLSADPAARFGSVEDLLTAMTTRPPPPRRRRRWPWLIAGLGVTATASIAAIALTRDRDAASGPAASSRCAGTEAMLDEIWNPGRRAALEQTLIARDPAAGADIARLVATVDRYAAGWNTMRHDACLATHVRHQQREDQLAGRAACLDQRAVALRTTLELIATAVMRPRDGWRLAEKLRPIDRCARDGGAVVPPRSAALDEVRLQLAEIAATVSKGARWDDLIALRGRIEHLDDPALLLEALLLEAEVALGRAEPEAADATARQALALAERLRDDLGKAHAGALLTEALVRLNRLTEAQGQLPQAVAALERGGGDWEVGIIVGYARASVARAGGERADELVALQDILDQERRRRGDDSFGVTQAALELATALQRDGQLVRAGELFDLVERAIGGDLPAAYAAGATNMFDSTQALLGGDFARAIEASRMVVSLYAGQNPPGIEYAGAVFALATTYEIAGEWPAAIDTYREAVRLYRDQPAGAAEAGKLVEALEGVARLEVELGNAAAAVVVAREALALAQSVGTPESVQTARLVLSRALLATAHPEEVLDLLEPVVRDLDADPDALAVRRAGATSMLAQALWATGGARERSRARSLIRDAIREYERARGDYAAQPAMATFRRLTEQRLAAAIEWQQRHP